MVGRCQWAGGDPPAISVSRGTWNNPLSQTTLPRRAAVPDSNGWRSSVLPPVILKPRNQPMAVRSRWASPWNTLLRLIRAL